MFSSDDFFKMLHDSPMYKSAYNTLKTDDERAKLDRFMHEKFSSIIEVLVSASQRVRDDPQFRSELQLALLGDNQVVINEDVVAPTTGSVG